MNEYKNTCIMNLSMSQVLSSMSSMSGILCPPSWRDTKILFLGTCVAALRQVAWGCTTLISPGRTG